MKFNTSKLANLFGGNKASLQAAPAVVSTDEPAGDRLAAPSGTTRPRSATNRSTKSTLSVSSSPRPRVSFRDEDDLEEHTTVVEAIYPALSNDEYDREPIEADLEDKGAVYDELIVFCEREMCVAKKSKDSVKHAYLRPGGQEKTQEKLRQRVKQLNAMQKNYSKQRQFALSGF